MDPLAVMLMIRINRENTLAMSRRRVPALDGYFDRINLALWPRLKVSALGDQPVCQSVMGHTSHQ